MGGGKYEKLIEDMALKDPRISFLGECSHNEVIKYLYKTNIFVFPSLYEGFGIALLEAMATGHACIVRDIPIMEEVLGKGNGLFCSNIEEMIKSLEIIVKNPSLRFKLRRNAAYKSRDYSWEKSAKKLLHLYEYIIKKKRKW